MTTRTTIRAVIAGVTAVLLLALSAVVLLDTGGAREAPGLTQRFRAIDAEYQRATREFVAQTQALEDADLRTALRLYGVALDAARSAQKALEQLEVVEVTARPTERMTRALKVQVLALESALSAARNRDEQAAAAASTQFQTGVVAYLAARGAMLDALRACGERCR